tara:strand:+ start:220 stop:447 length:228 start_codon:yes stop_codon:yes gene_type:complete
MKNTMNHIDQQVSRIELIASGLNKARRRGVCSHESRQGKGDPINVNGESTCTDCGKKATWEILDQDRIEVLQAWT